MRTRSMLVLIAVLGVAAPVFATRPTCDAVRVARSSGQSPEQIAQVLGTTVARVEACARIDEQHQQLAQNRQRFHFKRAERGLEQ